jgi:two-component system, chemotaxis family, response regulator Rcp1
MIDQAERSMEILLVEDNSTDVFLTEEALASTDIVNHLHVVGNGVEALKFLRKEGEYAQAPQPNIILLDLNLPIKRGCEVLAEIKADGALRHIPVIVLSTSNQELDIVRAYNLNANCYIVKPVSFHQFRVVLKAIESFWFTVVTLPT